MSAPTAPSGSLEVFISYAHEDEELVNALIKHLAVLKREGVIRAFHDRRIIPGAKWADEIDEHLESAHIILLLISSDFVNSEYCYEIEMKRALKRNELGAAKVIPIILRDCDWEAAPFGKLQALPSKGVPVTSWPSQDRAFSDVVRHIRRTVREFEGTAEGKPPQYRFGQKNSNHHIDEFKIFVRSSWAVILIAAGIFFRLAESSASIISAILFIIIVLTSTAIISLLIRLSRFIESGHRLEEVSPPEAELHNSIFEKLSQGWNSQELHSVVQRDAFTTRKLALNIVQGRYKLRDVTDDDK